MPYKCLWAVVVRQNTNEPRWMTNFSAEESAPCCWILVRSISISADGGAEKPGWRCSSKIGRPKFATRKQASNKFRALMRGLPKASAMMYTGWKWHVQSGVSLVKDYADAQFRAKIERWCLREPRGYGPVCHCSGHGVPQDTCGPVALEGLWYQNETYRTSSLLKVETRSL